VTGAFAHRTLFQDSLKSFEPASTARRYEMGTPSMPAIYGSAPALEYLLEIGMANIAGHIKTLRDALADGLRSLQIPTKTSLQNVGPMIVVRTANAEAVAAKLAEKQIIVSPKFDGLRISFHVYNTLDDICLVLEALAENIDLILPERVPSVIVRGDS
jgi:selenocysteine lyase/cysteine desulfurase